MERDDIFHDDPSGRSPLALDQDTLLNDQFRIGRVLGVGGFGITYLAFDEVLEMVVAVKEYLPSDIAVRKSDSHTVQPFSSSGEEKDFEFGLERFLQEARTLAKFEAHDNIVRVRTFFRENGTGYLVMNFYEGRTLAEYLAARNGFLPEEEALLIMEQVLDGLTSVHEESILHRDVDPNNVYLADNGTVVLLDFGAARTAVGERTQSMSVVLKRGYAPHEQYHSHGDQGPWTDVYACAATLYRALTGYKPPEAAARILEDDLAPPKELVPSLSDATNEAVMRGLSIRPDDRPQTMAEFAALFPDPSDDAVPGWIGEVTTMEMETADPDAVDAELRLTSTHPCRLYVDGSRAAELDAAEAYTLGVETGTHRLRAVRTDQASGGTATVTASDTGGQEAGDARMTLDSLMWQDVVSVSSGDATAVDIDFHEEASAAASLATEEAAGDGESRPVPEAPPEPDDTVAATDTPAAAGPDDSTAAATATGDAPTEEAPTEEAPKGAAPAPEREPAPPDAPAPAAEEDGGGTRAVGPLVGGVAAVAVLLALGWWLMAGGGGPAPVPQPDPVLMSGERVIDVVANDRHPSGGALRVVGAGPVPDSVARVSVVDSSRVRVQVAGGFAGTAQVPYAVAGPGGDTARAHVALRVPFSGEGRLVTQAVDQPQVVHTDVLGDDASLDVLVAALGDRALAWSENVGAEQGWFRDPRAIEEAVDGVVDLSTADLTGDGHQDVLSASLRSNVVAWYENQGDGAFGDPQPLSTTAEGAAAVQAADVDGDGDRDVISGALLDQTVTWYENEGGGQFGEGTPIATDVGGLESVHVSDLDRDDVPDVVVVAYKDRSITRYEPQVEDGAVQFVERPPVGTALEEPITVHTADVTGNGREDVIAGTVGTESILLFENQPAADGANPFGEGRVLAPNLRTVEDIDTGDFDNDGDLDIFAAAFDSDRVVWLENRGDGTFSEPQPVVTDVPDILSIDVADVDRDGDVDVLAASQARGTVVWYENRLPASGR